MSDVSHTIVQYQTIDLIFWVDDQAAWSSILLFTLFRGAIERGLTCRTSFFQKRLIYIVMRKNRPELSLCI